MNRCCQKTVGGGMDMEHWCIEIWQRKTEIITEEPVLVPVVSTINPTMTAIGAHPELCSYCWWIATWTMVWPFWRRRKDCPLCFMSQSTRVVAALSGQKPSALTASSVCGLWIHAWRTRAVVPNLWAVAIITRALHTDVASQQFLLLHPELGFCRDE